MGEAGRGLGRKEARQEGGEAGRGQAVIFFKRVQRFLNKTNLGSVQILRSDENPIFNDVISYGA